MLEDCVLKPKIVLNREELTLPIYQIKQLNVITESGFGDETITWSSTDETVATVDSNGLITALKEGTTTITATLGEKELSCIVAVSGRLGDLDKDNNITSYDAYKALKTSVDYLVDIEVDEQIILTADANKNGELESDDAYEILKYSVGLINKF